VWGRTPRQVKCFLSFFRCSRFYSQKKGKKKMGKVRVIGSWQGFYLGTAASIGKMSNTLTLLGAFCIFIASVAGCKINLNFGATSFLALSLYPARVR